ncbi:MAG: hypothetical protein FWH40_03680 [Coriobacteriia bacterium]|nr:hypothetical protein [Coriobacteriia bacterium]
MEEGITLYALKVRDAYVKFDESGYSLVEMNKASVFPQIEDLVAKCGLVGRDPSHALDDIRIVAMTVIETEVALPDSFIFD